MQTELDIDENIRIEESFIGRAIVHESESLELISEEDLYDPFLKKVYNEMREGSRDIVMLIDKFWRDDINRIVSLTDKDWTDPYWMSKKIKLNASKRRAYLLGETMKNFAKNAESDEELELKLFNFSNELSKQRSVSVDDKYSIDDSVIELESWIREGVDGLRWLSSWIEFLDWVTWGFQPKRIYRIGAPSNTGKSQLAYGLIRSFLQQGKKVLFFTLENERKTTILNLLSNFQGVNPNDIVNRKVSWDYQLLVPHRDSLFICDDKYDIDAILGTINTIKPDVVVLDHISKIRKKGCQPMEVFRTYADSVQNFVKHVPVIWIDISQLPKNMDEEFLINTWSFFGADELKSEADIGIHMFPYKPFYEHKKKIKREGIDTLSLSYCGYVKIVITKNRFGVNQEERIFKIDFNKWGKFIEETKEELERFEL